MRKTWPPMPPTQMPAARTVVVPERGEFFVRDSGGSGHPVMLLHGWMASADMNWWAVYGDLLAAGYRVLAIDHRGHGRGLRPLEPFRLADCAADAAAVLRTIGAAPATVVGYSMGGAIAQLVARDHSDVCDGVILSGTAQHWQDPRTRYAFRGLGVMGIALSLAPRTFYRLGLRRSGIRDEERSAWVQSELLRHSARDLVEAGRELGRFDSRPWLGSVAPPIAVVLTTRDDLVAPRKQRELSAAAHADVFEVPIRHLEVGMPGTGYGAQLLAAIEAVSGAAAALAA